MKKYKRKVPLVSPAKTAVFALCFVLISIVLAVVIGADNEYFAVCIVIASLAIILDLFVIIGAGGRYSFSDKYVNVFFGPFVCKKLDYRQFSAIVISNASYNNGYGYRVSADIPMKYRIKTDNKTAKTVLPYITFHKSGYPISKIAKGMSSRDLFMLNDEQIYCLGICWFDSFREVLSYTNCDVYILGDVYFRFKEQFDNAFSEHSQKSNRFHIVN